MAACMAPGCFNEARYGTFRCTACTNAQSELEDLHRRAENAIGNVKDEYAKDALGLLLELITKLQEA